MPILDYPFVKLLKGDDSAHYFVYDVVSNQLLGVDKIIWDILSMLGNDDSATISRNLSTIYSIALIEKALSEIAVFQQDRHCFQANPLKSFKRPCRKNMLGRILAHKIGHVILEVTQSCNLKCDYCNYSGTYPQERRHTKVKMTRKIAVKCINFLASHCDDYEGEFLSVGFYGGEPLLEYNLIQMVVNECKSVLLRPVQFSITTNGTLLNQAVVKYLVDENISLQVSLDGSREIHDRYRKNAAGTGSFDRIINNLQLMKQIYPDYFKHKVGFNIVISPPFQVQNVMTFFSTNELVASHPVTITLVDPFDTSFYNDFSWAQHGNDYNRELDVLANEYINLVREFKHPQNLFLTELFGKKLQNFDHRPFNLLHSSVYPNGICIPGAQRLFIDAKGNFFPCERGGKTTIGDIYEGFNVPVINRLIDSYIQTSSDCLSCWAVRLCQSCFSMVCKNGKIDLQKKRAQCENIRASYEKYLLLYTKIMEVNPDIFPGKFKGL